ncbi:unnamed protein product, partial [Rotaria magnacalcarata]
MQAMNFLQQTSLRLVINTSRPTFSALSYSKSSETQAKTDANRVESNSVTPNDLLEAKRLAQT